MNCNRNLKISTGPKKVKSFTSLFTAISFNHNKVASTEFLNKRCYINLQFTIAVITNSMLKLNCIWERHFCLNNIQILASVTDVIEWVWFIYTEVLKTMYLQSDS